MRQMNKWAAVSTMLVVALLLSTLVTPSWAQSAATRFNRLIVNQSLTSVGTTTLTGAVTTGASLTAGDDLISTDDVTVGDDATIGDDLAITGDLRLVPATTISVTMNATITPLGAYQPLSSAGTVNTASITVGTAGKELTLVNTTATSIVFTDTGTLKLTGNITLGQYDSLRLISDGTSWIMLGTANN